MIIRILISTILITCGSCTSVNEAAASYFRLSKPMAGTESPTQIMERVNGKSQLQRLLYPHVKPQKIVQCTILRNQLYVAALKGTSGAEGKEIADAALLMEKAYQEDDDSFLAACAQIISSKVGQSFWHIALNYIKHTQ